MPTRTFPCVSTCLFRIWNLECNSCFRDADIHSCSSTLHWWRLIPKTIVAGRVSYWESECDRIKTVWVCICICLLASSNIFCTFISLFNLHLWGLSVCSFSRLVKTCIPKPTYMVEQSPSHCWDKTLAQEWQMGANSRFQLRVFRRPFIEKAWWALPSKSLAHISTAAGRKSGLHGSRYFPADKLFQPVATSQRPINFPKLLPAGYHVFKSQHHTCLVYINTISYICLCVYVYIFVSLIENLYYITK